MHPVVVVKVVMVILVKIDFRKGHFCTIIYKYIYLYIIEYFSFFPFSILTILTMTIMTIMTTILYHSMCVNSVPGTRVMCPEKKWGEPKKKSPKDSSTAMEYPYLCSVE